MAKYECDICGWIYDPAIGDPENGIDPGTPFEELPDDWTCPECGAPKSAFSMVEDRLFRFRHHDEKPHRSRDAAMALCVGALFQSADGA